jgi:ABC-type transporter Mla maintaining outer membrane lipid asymmetry ATPase subunit MlaF
MTTSVAMAQPNEGLLDHNTATPLIDVQDLTTAFGSHVVHEHLNLKYIQKKFWR